MVDDPEKHIQQTGQYKKPDPWEKRTTQKQKREKKYEEQNIRFQITLIPVRTCKVRVMTQLLFEASNARTCVDVYKAWF